MLLIISLSLLSDTQYEVGRNMCTAVLKAAHREPSPPYAYWFDFRVFKPIMDTRRVPVYLGNRQNGITRWVG